MRELQRSITHAYTSAPSGGDVGTLWVPISNVGLDLPPYLFRTTLMVFRRRAEAIWMTACPTPLFDAFWMTESPVEEIQVKSCKPWQVGDSQPEILGQI